jgi:hypothetical protein
VRLERSECPAALEIFGAGPEPDGARRGMVIAKLTYAFDARGRLELDESDPFEVQMADVATPLGLLPSDDVDRRDGRFDVMLLGSATSAVGPAAELTVTLSVGEVSQRLRVVGDRALGADGRVSAPRPFREMPLTWERAFGGSAIVEIDHDSPVLVQDIANPVGRGLDVAAKARALADQFGCPPGFPRFDPVRRLPNVLPDTNDAAELAPPAVGWAPRAVAQLSDPHFRGDPAFVFASAPAPGTPIVLEGLTPEGHASFAFPGERVRFDYALGEEDRTRYLRPTTLVLLPDERRFYVVHRLPFLVGDPEGLERRGVVRVMRGGVS